MNKPQRSTPTKNWGNRHAVPRIGLALSLAIVLPTAAQTTHPVPVVASESSGAAATAGPTDGFPAGARALEAADLQARLKDRRFEARLADGTGWRIAFQGGFVYVDLSNGARDNGPWKTEASRLCVDYRGRFPSGCNEMRELDGAPLLKRPANGEIVRLSPKT